MTRVVAEGPVGIVGAGPVGMALALLLDRHGVPTVVFDAQPGPFAQPRGNTHNARTMEHYRRLGIADRIRRLGLPQGHRTDIAYFTRYRGHELGRLRLPSETDRMRSCAAADATDQTPEPVLRANQMYVERFLHEHARTRPNIRLRHGWRVESFEQDAAGVTVLAERDGRRATWRTSFLVGCDGGQSAVRRAIGVRYEGAASVDSGVLGRRATAAWVRLPTLFGDLPEERRGWSYWAINADLACNLISLDGADEFFLLTSSVDPDADGPGVIGDLIARAAGAPTEVEVLGHRPWTPGSALVAERFGDRRVLLAGDAAHLFTPTGGFGMNTGVDDAANLAWKLAAVLQGWGGKGLLASYEAERRPVALRNTAAARRLNLALAEIDRPPELEEDSPAGARVRAATGAALTRYGESTHALGVQLGARYDGSAIVAGDEEPPPDLVDVYLPSAVPGGRAPHVWLDDWHGPGSSLHDRLGTGFTLLRLGSRPACGTGLRRAARRGGIPLATLDVPDPAARDVYGRDLVLVRPDQHVAWRGNAEPEDPDAVLAGLAGF